ncbi:MAG TPA: DUF5127 domain-containing protein, partial [Puia sp.]|nr:DUF5127 domain-containing protein [Puia sp.]
MVRHFAATILVTCLLSIASGQVRRMPAYPLITHDTYFSVWSFTDDLDSSNTVHWTGKRQDLLGILTVDGRPYRFLGHIGPGDTTTAADQQWVDVTATQTRYQFDCGGVDLTLTFTSPLLLPDLSVLSRPVTYVSFRLRSNDGAAHTAQLDFDVSTLLAVNTPDERVRTASRTAGPLRILRAGTRAQPVLKKKGDDLRIDWGWLYVAAPNETGLNEEVKTAGEPLAEKYGPEEGASVPALPAPISLCTRFAPVRVAEEPVNKLVMVGYDERYCVEFFHQKLEPWWRTHPESGGKRTTMEELLQRSYAERDRILSRCDTFDKMMYVDALDAGGDHYAQLCVAAYRQSIAAHALTMSPQGEILFLSKENFSNGSINTVDVTYPSAPLY